MTGRTIVFVGVAVALISLVGCKNNTSSPTGFATPMLSSTTGNGAPNGTHYNLNIIGVPKSKSADMDSTQGHRIFVNLTGNSKIYLAEGDVFAVLDANGTDGDGAKFQLPDPFADSSLIARYSVFARALGKPNGSSQMTTCFTDSLGDTYCSVDTLTLTRTSGKQKFENVSSELLTILADINADGVTERIGLFDSTAYNYYWSYDNYGLKLAQLRFYPIPDTL